MTRKKERMERIRTSPWRSRINYAEEWNRTTQNKEEIMSKESKWHK